MLLNDLLNSGFNFNTDERFVKNQYQLLNAVIILSVLAQIPLVVTFFNSDVSGFQWHARLSIASIFISMSVFFYVRLDKKYYKTGYLVFLSFLLINMIVGLNVVTIHDDRAVWFGVFIIVAYFLGGKKTGQISFITSLVILIFHAAFVDLQMNSETLLDSILMVLVFGSLGALYEKKYRIDVEMLEFSNYSLEGTIQRKDALMLKHFYEDRITSLPNREAFCRDMKEQHIPMIALLSIKEFRNLNNTYGYDVVNELIVYMVDFIGKHMSGTLCSMYHVGPNDLIIMNQVDMSQKTFEEMTSYVLTKIQEHTFTFKKQQLEIDVDIVAGICFEKEAILEKSNAAMQKAKSSRENYIVYSPELSLLKQQRSNISLTHEIKNAIIQDNIVVYYQAIVDSNLKIIKYESLVRMIVDGEVKSPEYFLDFSKKTHYYHEITKIVIRKSFENFYKSDFQFSINLSYEDIINEETGNYIKSALALFPKPEHVIFEIVESEEFYNSEVVDTFIKDIKDLGAKIAIDDFGTGYSNFSQLLKLETDILKIDGSLIKSLDTDSDMLMIVSNIIGFAKSMKLKVVAEFIHCEAIFLICKELGVDEFQGFYFSKPLSKVLVK